MKIYHSLLMGNNLLFCNNSFPFQEKALQCVSQGISSIQLASEKNQFCLTQAEHLLYSISLNFKQLPTLEWNTYHYQFLSQASFSEPNIIIVSSQCYYPGIKFVTPTAYLLIFCLPYSWTDNWATYILWWLSIHLYPLQMSAYFTVFIFSFWPTHLYLSSNKSTFLRNELNKIPSKFADTTPSKAIVPFFFFFQ